jgi:ankyrin repeat protein
MKPIGLLCVILVLVFMVGGCKKKSAETTTPLHNAAQAGDTEQVRALLSGGDVNAKDKVGRTPLHRAADSGFKGIVELLIANGAHINAKDKDGHSPLYFAAIRGRRDVVELLLGKGADVSTLHLAACLGDLARLKSLIRLDAFGDGRDKIGRTPLHFANSKVVA